MNFSFKKKTHKQSLWINELLCNNSLNPNLYTGSDLLPSNMSSSSSSICTIGEPVIPLGQSLTRALQNATKEGDLVAMGRLVEQGADVNGATEGLCVTALHCAARNGDATTMKWLLEHGASIDKRGRNGMTPLYYAANHGHIAAIMALLDHGADVNLRCTNMTMSTPLHFAATKGHMPAMKVLVEHGADMNVQNCKGFTPVVCAVKNRKKEAAEWLEKKGCLKCAEYEKAVLHNSLHDALLANDVEALAAIVEKGAIIHELFSVPGTHGEIASALSLAAAQGHIETLEWLTKHGAVAVQDGSHMTRTAAEMADALRRVHCGDVLARAPVTATPATEINSAVTATPVTETTATDTPTTVTETLLKAAEMPTAATVTPTTVTETPTTATETLTAVTESPTAVTETPTAVTDTPTTATDSPNTATETPTAVTETPIVEATAPTIVQTPPLHWAARKCSIVAMEWLWKHGADLNAIDRYKQTALHWAADSNQVGAVAWLLSHPKMDQWKSDHDGYR
jgi:ankyrin repeat protein